MIVLTQVSFSLSSSSCSQGLWMLCCSSHQMKVTLRRLSKNHSLQLLQGAAGSSGHEMEPKNQSRERTPSPTSRAESQLSIHLHHSYIHYTFSLRLRAKLWNLFALRGNYSFRNFFLETDNSAR